MRYLGKKRDTNSQEKRHELSGHDSKQAKLIAMTAIKNGKDCDLVSTITKNKKTQLPKPFLIKTVSKITTLKQWQIPTTTTTSTKLTKTT